MRVLWSGKAIKQLKRIGDRKLRARIADAVGALECVESPDELPNARRLIRHTHDWRLRVGDWRVLFDVIEGEPLIASIEEVKKRDERTY